MSGEFARGGIKDGDEQAKRTLDRLQDGPFETEGLFLLIDGSRDPQHDVR